MLKVKKPRVPSTAFRDAKKRIAEISKILKNGQLSLAVGLPSDSLPYPDGTSVVAVGFWNEFGTEQIPERPWLRTSLERNRRKWLLLAADAFELAVARNREPEQVLRVVGEVMEADTKISIDSGAWEPNSASTAAIKQTRGKTKPLIDTGHMRASVRYIIREKGE